MTAERKTTTTTNTKNAVKIRPAGKTTTTKNIIKNAGKIERTVTGH